MNLSKGEMIIKRLLSDETNELMLMVNTHRFLMQMKSNDDETAINDYETKSFDFRGFGTAAWTPFQVIRLNLFLNINLFLSSRPSTRNAC